MNTPKLRFPEFSGSWKPIKAGEAFKSRRSRGKEGLPIYSVTVDRGMVRRDSLGRQIEADAADGENLRALRGDLVYNMMRMWQGAVGQAPEECMVSPAYVVLDPKPGVSSDFFEHWFKSKRMIYQFWAYSQGLTSDRLRLYFDDFAQIPLHITSIKEQTKISDFLSAVDERIDQLCQELELLIKYKNAVMRKVFSRELRLKNTDSRAFPDWDFVPLREVFSEVRERVRDQDLETYSISAGKGFVSQKEKFGKDISGNQNANYVGLCNLFSVNFRIGGHDIRVTG